MKLYQNTMHGLRHGGWSRAEAVAYFVKGAARELHIMPSFFRLLHEAKVAQCEERRNFVEDNKLERTVVHLRHKLFAEVETK